MSHQHDIDDMMREIALEFKDSIFSKPSNQTPVIPENYWVALDKNQVIGTVGLIPVRDEYVVLKKMMLKKAYRGHKFGISKLLLETVINWCKAQQISRIYLGTMNQFKAAQVFYVRNGFHQIPSRYLPHDFLRNPLDDVFFIKDLDLN